MDGWMDGWMGGWMDGWVGGWMDGWTMGRWMFRQMGKFYLDGERSQEHVRSFKEVNSEPTLRGWSVEVFRWRFRMKGRNFLTLISQMF